MRGQFRIGFWLFLLLAILALKSVAGNPAACKTILTKDVPSPSKLSGRSFLSNLEAEESSNLNEVAASYKLPFAEVALHLQANISTNPLKVLDLGQKTGVTNITPPHCRYILYPFHAFW